jgi:hypothetical protein
VGALHTGGIGCTLPTGRSVKTKIPVIPAQNAEIEILLVEEDSDEQNP